MTQELTIQIVGWNSEEHLGNAATVLANIPSDQVVIRYIDNGSTDNSVEMVKRILPHADVIELPENFGYAKAHNIGFSKCTTPFVATHDPDIVINWEGIQKLLKAFQDEKVASVQGKLFRANTNNTVIDSAGIIQTFTGNGKERGAGEVDEKQFEEPSELLATTGALSIYRMSALRKIAYSPEEFFDNQFFAYKEDVDLGWRLQKADFKNMYVPVSCGTHARTLGKRGSLPWFINPTEAPRRLMSPRTRYSIRNYVWMLAKNLTVVQAIILSPFIALRLVYIFLLTLLVPPLFSVWGETLRFLPSMLQKRVITKPL